MHWTQGRQQAESRHFAQKRAHRQPAREVAQDRPGDERRLRSLIGHFEQETA